MSPPDAPTDQQLTAMLRGLSLVFESLGRASVCLSRDFRVLHASPALDALLAPGTAEYLAGRTAAQVFGEELFGPGGNLREALQHGDRREGWGATLEGPDGRTHWVSLTAAPMKHVDESWCDPRVAYVVVMRAGEEARDLALSGVSLFAGMVARSEPMKQLFRFVEQLSESDATVLVTGESGTGKELIAHAIHQHSPRSRGPFVAVNSAALPAELLESELFGHVRGAFTGAVRDREGRFERARGGTLFLDEVGDLPLALQVKLLRVLQERAFERVGESVTRQADARIIAATNMDLKRAVQEGRFREDLYYRLRVVPVEVPPLRARREDIEPLAQHLLMRVGARHGRAVRLSPDAIRSLVEHDWPGNVRELENALEYALAVSRGQTLHAADLPREVLRTGAAPAPAGNAQSTTRTPIEVREREQIRAALEAHRWRREEAAHALGMSRTTLWRKMREYGLLDEE